MKAHFAAGEKEIEGTKLQVTILMQLNEANMLSLEEIMGQTRIPDLGIILNSLALLLCFFCRPPFGYKMFIMPSITHRLVRSVVSISNGGSKKKMKSSVEQLVLRGRLLQSIKI